MSRTLFYTVFPLVFLVVLFLNVPLSESGSDAIYTSTSEVRALLWDGDALWAATAGGVLRFQNGTVTKWTRQNGLPSHEAFDIRSESDTVTVRFPTARARWNGTGWVSQTAPEWKRPVPTAIWKGKEVTATLDTLQIGESEISLPGATRGTHISALWPREETLLVAVYGDGLWQWNGTDWMRGPQLPEEACEILSLTGSETSLFVGTRRNGVFRLRGDTWEKLPIPNLVSEPFAHNIQFLIEYKNMLWASTLDDGLIARTGQHWHRAAPPQISSSAARQMLVWRERLYVRHGNGVVDAFDGARWTKNALHDLPRRGVYALAGNQEYLLAGGWGGWAQWNGKMWEKLYDFPGLKGVPIMQLALQGEDVWIGTQSRGLAKWTRATNELRFYDEREGLRDDWITSLLVDGERVWAGTFVGGLHVFKNGKWRAFDATKGENITALAADGRGGVWAATRRGLFHAAKDHAGKIEARWLDEEIQALHKGVAGLWIGTRTSLNLMKH